MPHRLIHRHQLAQQGQGGGGGVVGDLISAVVGDVADFQPMFGAGGEVDVVVANAVADHRGTRFDGGGGRGAEGGELHHGDIGTCDRAGDVLGGFALMGCEVCTGGLRGGSFLVKGGEGVIRDDDFHGVTFR